MKVHLPADSQAERIAALEARLAAAEGRIAQLEAGYTTPAIVPGHIFNARNYPPGAVIALRPGETLADIERPGYVPQPPLGAVPDVPEQRAGVDTRRCRRCGRLYPGLGCDEFDCGMPK